MNNKEILANAPKGATHYTQGLGYLAFNVNSEWVRYDANGFAGAKWFEANDYKFSYVKDFRSLVDIQELVDRDKRIAKLEKDSDDLKNIIIAHQVADETGHIDGEGWVDNYSEMCETVSKLLEAHSLEQQARELNEYAYSGKPLTKRELNIESIALNEQANKIKGGTL